MEPIDRRRLHFVCVLHVSALTNTKMRQLYYAALMWMEKLGCLPDRVSHSLERSGNYVVYSRAKKKLEENLEDIQDFTLCRLNEGRKHTYEGYQCMFGGHRKNGEIILDIDIGVFEQNRAFVFKILAELANEYCIQYGYGFIREFCRGPYYYALCMKYGDYYPGEEDTGVMMWFHATWGEKLFLRNAWVRSVYPWNWLTSIQLDASIEGMSLKKWILADQSRGRLSSVADGILLWEVTEESIPQVRKALHAAGRIFDYQRDIVAKLPPAAETSMEEATAQVLDAFGVTSPDEVEIRKGDNQPISEEAKKDIFKKKRKK